jgi:NAD(P)H-dependent flavin oxidoreductase YrpB (nitropropane dioxygenase family)
MKRDHHSTDGMFGLEHPIVLALMGTVSGGRLAAAVCRTPAGWGPSAWDSVGFFIRAVRLGAGLRSFLRP